ncbi:MAG: septum formation inhibitor Maf [Epulopiscium sp.]|nr:septum formation inhibitor Maf [Candidatus Epulonipiscium sp.]
MKKIILASKSPRRQALLKQIGLSFEIKVSDIEEEIDKNLPIEEQVQKLAYDKAKAVEVLVKEPCIIIGADTIVTCGEHILGKPKNTQDAYRMLHMLQGQIHTVYTGVAILEKDRNQLGSSLCFTESARVYMKALSNEEIWSYIDSKEPNDKAGSYAIQGKGSIFVERIEGDYNTVVGLPLARLYDALKNKIDIKKYWLQS